MELGHELLVRDLGSLVGKPTEVRVDLLYLCFFTPAMMSVAEHYTGLEPCYYADKVSDPPKIVLYWREVRSEKLRFSAALPLGSR